MTATKLLQKYGTLEEIYKNIDTVEPESLKKKLVENYEQALMSKKLAQIILDVPFQLNLEDCKYSNLNKIKVKEILEKYNFKSLLRRMGFEVEGDSSKSREEKKSDNQLPLL